MGGKGRSDWRSGPPATSAVLYQACLCECHVMMDLITSCCFALRRTRMTAPKLRLTRHRQPTLTLTLCLISSPDPEPLPQSSARIVL